MCKGIAFFKFRNTVRYWFCYAVTADRAGLHIRIISLRQPYPMSHKNSPLIFKITVFYPFDNPEVDMLCTKYF